MAYKPLDIKIVPGGLNLLAPGDAVPPGDSLDLTGFWPGAAGRLQQAPGYATLSASHLGFNFDSIGQSSGRTYFGAGGSLFQVGRAGEVAIDTGYDGYPLGMVSTQGYQWIINRAKQRKDDGTTVTDWTPAAPAIPAVTQIAFVTGATNATPIVIDTGAIEHGQIDGQGLTITGVVGNTGANTVGFSKKTGYSLTTFGLYSDAALTIPVAGTGAYVSGGTIAGGGLQAAAYQYYVTWQYVDLGESGPSPVAEIAPTVANAVVSISIAALTPPTSATGWNIYRSGPDLGTIYRLNENVIPLARTFVYDYGDAAHLHSDQDLINLGAILEADHDPAPAARIMANQTFNGRIVVANSAAFPNRVWFTPALQPGFFRGAANPQVGDWVDIGTDRGDEVLFLAVKPNQIIVYRAKSIWRILYDFDDPNSRIDVVVPDLGIVGPRAVVCTSLGDYFRASEGIYKFNGDWAQKISSDIDPIFMGQTVENFGGETQAYRSNCALGFHAGRLWVSYTWGVSGTSNSACFVYHVDSQRWFPRNIGAGAFLDTGTALLSTGAFYVLSLETGYFDGPGNTIVAYQTAYQDGGFPDHEKSWADLVVNHNTGGQTLTVRARTNKSATATDAFDLDTTLTSSTLTKTTVPLVYPLTYSILALRGLPIRSYNLSIRITGVGPIAAPSAPLVIDSPLVLHYYLEARKALLFDTDEMDHDMPGVTKTVDMVEFDIDTSPGPAVLQIYSDIPGGTMIPQLIAGVGRTIRQTTGRETVRIVLAAPVDGKLLRYVASTTSGFNVYGFRARVTAVGVYVDGSVAETWDTRAIPIAG